MKVIALNASPRKNNGNTALILNPFLEGIKDAGAVVDVYQVYDLEINPCHGDFSCWLKNPGVCSQDDDMKWLNPEIASADVLVLASPVYCDGFTGPMKTLMDRMIPGALPFMELRDGHIRHPGRYGSKKRRIALVSNCGLWEMDNFDVMVAHTKAYCRNVNAEFAGALLRPHGEAMKGMMERGISINDIFEAARVAGHEVIIDGKISEETSSRVSRELISRDLYMQIANQTFENMLRKN